MNSDQKSLAIVLLLLACAACARSYFSLRTGFMLPDEGLYVHATIGNFYIRPAFILSINLFKKLLNVRNLHDMLAVGGFYGMAFSAGAVFGLYKIFKMTVQDNAARAFSLLSLVFLPMFMILSTTWLTEAPSFCFIIFGTYALLKSFNGSHCTGHVVLSAAFFAAAAFVRESFWIFAVGNTILLVFLKIRKHRIPKVGIPAFLLVSILTVPYIALEVFGLPMIFPWHFPMLVTDVPTGVPIFGIPPEKSPINPLKAVSNFFFSTFVAYSLIPMIMALLGTALLFWEVVRGKEKSAGHAVLLSTSIFGFLSFIMMCVRLSMFSPVYMATIIRFAYVSYPAVVAIPRAYSFLSSRLKKISFGLTPVCLILAVLIGFPVLQSGLSVAPIGVYFDWNYQTPYYRAYNYISSIENSRVLLFTEPFVRVSLFFTGNENVSIYHFNDATFKVVVQYEYWDKILVYGEFYTNYYYSLELNSPFFLELIQNRTSFETRTIWWDSESYMLEVVVN